jgi:hypothetical protein
MCRIARPTTTACIPAAQVADTPAGLVPARRWTAADEAQRAADIAFLRMLADEEA